MCLDWGIRNKNPPITPEWSHQLNFSAAPDKICNSSIKYVVINVTIKTETRAEVLENFPKAF